jgi:hypothetical protein
MTQTHTIYAVTRVLVRSQRIARRVGSAHSWLFHGDATRGRNGPLTWTLQFEVYGEHSEESLYLIRSGRLLPSLFSPGVELVVSQDLLSKIGPGKGLFMAKETKIDRFIDFFIDKESGYELEFGGAVERSQFFVNNYPIMAVLNAPRYFEIVLSRLDETVWQIQDCLKAGVRNDLDEIVELRVPTLWLDDDLLCSTGSMIVMSERIFSILEPHLDVDFYRYESIRLSD